MSGTKIKKVPVSEHLNFGNARSPLRQKRAAPHQAAIFGSVFQRNSPHLPAPRRIPEIEIPDSASQLTSAEGFAAPCSRVALPARRVLRA